MLGEDLALAIVVSQAWAVLTAQPITAIVRVTDKNLHEQRGKLRAGETFRFLFACQTPIGVGSAVRQNGQQ